MSGRVYQRWDRSQVRQHQLLMISTGLLILTGLPLRYANTAVVKAIAPWLGGAEMAGAVHRVAAVGLLVVAIWHVVYLIGRRRRGQLSWSMAPARQDLVDIKETVQFLLGRRETEPQHDRYSVIEKFEYWAVLWGSAVMLLSGVVLWFPVRAAALVGGVGIELAKVVHGYEALLAALSIAIWHMYHAHLRYDVFPMNRMWLTGTLTEAEMRHHHPLELARLEAAEAAALAEQAAAQEDEALDAAETTAAAADGLDRPVDDAAGLREAAGATDGDGEPEPDGDGGEDQPDRDG